MEHTTHGPEEHDPDEAGRQDDPQALPGASPSDPPPEPPELNRPRAIDRSIPVFGVLHADKDRPAARHPGDRVRDRIDEGPHGPWRTPVPESSPARGMGAPAAVALAFVSGVSGAAILAIALVAAGVIGGDSPPAPPSSPTSVVEVREIITDGAATAPAPVVARKVVPSIVTVEVGSSGDEILFDPLGTGSGVVLSGDGKIVTNHHVIEGTNRTRVTFQDGRVYAARVLGSDPLTDLAVLQIDADGLIPVDLGSTESLAIGDPAIAVGNPLGLRGGASLTVGVVSAFDREVTVRGGARLFGMLQTDAPITEGSSGGALVDGEGRLIGITTAIGVSSAGAEGIGFAIPVELVQRITDEIISTGDVRHAFLGVQLQDSLEDVGDGSRIPTGALITGFAGGESAARGAGLEVGDLITKFDDQSVLTRDDLIIGIRRYRVGQTIELEVIRDGEAFAVSLDLGQRPGDV